VRAPDSAEHLRDRLFDLILARRGRLPLRTRPMSLVEMVARAVEAVRPRLAATAGPMGAIGTAPDAFVDADPVRLPEAVAGLLEHVALRTSRAEGVTVSIEVAGRGVLLRVGGPGAAADPLPTAEDVFAGPGDAAWEGLARALVRATIEAHGGDVVPAEGGYVVRLPISTTQVAARPQV
jgi:K+-sensing histidine kinase KdpD